MFKGMMKVIGEFAANLMKSFLPLMSDQLRQLLENWIEDFKERAADTPNMWDDVVADFLATLLGMD